MKHELDSPELAEVEINHEASNFISRNYNTVVAWAKAAVRGSSCGVDYQDAVNDLYARILENELDGRGFDPSKGIPVEAYIQSMVKLYVKNSKYLSATSYVKGKNAADTVTISSLDQLEDARSDSEEFYDSGLEKQLAKIASGDDFTLLVNDRVMIDEYVRKVIEYEKTTGCKIRKIVLGEFDIDSHERVLKALFSEMPKSLIEALTALINMDHVLLKRKFAEIDKQQNSLVSDDWILAY